MRGDIHLHDLGFVDRPYCSGQSLEYLKRFGLSLPNSIAMAKPAKHPEVLLAHMVKFAAALQSHFAGAIGWDSVNLFFAPYFVGLADRDLEQLAQMMIFEFSQQAVASLPLRQTSPAVPPPRQAPPVQPPLPAQPPPSPPSPVTMSLPSDQESERPRPLTSRRGGIPLWAWIAGGVVLLGGACALGSLLLAGLGLFPQARPVTSQPPPETQAFVETTGLPASPPAQSGGAFRDDFSDPASGWERWEGPEGMTDYDAGGYRIFIDRPHQMSWATPGREYTGVSIEVDVQKIAGADDNYFGILCRYQDENNFYLLWISSDGYYGIEKFKDGDFIPPNEKAHGFHRVIHQGKTTNQLRADCIGDTLTLYANDSNLATLEDSDFRQGAIGLFARSTDLAGTNLLFDNLVLREP